MQVVDYDPSRRAEVAALMDRVWGQPADEAELGWLFEGNPVRPASVLLGEEGGLVVGSVAMSFVRMSLAGEEREVGMPIRLATDPAHRGKGVFAELQAQNEERARTLGVRLLLIVPNSASTPILLGRLGWSRLAPLRIWARLKAGGAKRSAAAVERFSGPVQSSWTGDRVLRDLAWLNWRFADSPTPYTLLEGHGYGAAGSRGRAGILAVSEGALLRPTVVAAPGRVVIAAPPPGQAGRYLRAGFLPTHRTLTVLGKSLHPEQGLPARPHFELGDLDFL